MSVCSIMCLTWLGRAQITHLFRDVLHGWGQLLLIANVSTSAADYEESSAVLRYATLACEIGTAVRAEPPVRMLQ